MSLRITSPSKSGGPRRGPGGEELEPDFYMSRLIKLLPAEAVAVYPLLRGRAQDVVDDVEALRKAESGATQNAAAVADGAVAVTPAAADGVAAVATGEGVSGPATAGLASLPPIESTDWLIPAMAWCVLLMVILLRWQATRDSAGNAQWGAVAIAAISFFLWVPTMGDSFGVMEFATATGLISWPDPVQKFIPEFLLIFWTLFIPAFYKPDN
ncbi:MAG: hypothetical protein K0U74_10090 [Alphaproteobacteria bacterium]|nr:hypothetical protein [Alphaproteobacteria bacterium]